MEEFSSEPLIDDPPTSFLLSENGDLLTVQSLTHQEQDNHNYVIVNVDESGILDHSFNQELLCESRVLDPLCSSIFRAIPPPKTSNGALLMDSNQSEVNQSDVAEHSEPNESEVIKASNIYLLGNNDGFKKNVLQLQTICKSPINFVSSNESSLYTSKTASETCGQVLHIDTEDDVQIQSTNFCERAEDTETVLKLTNSPRKQLQSSLKMRSSQKTAQFVQGQMCNSSQETLICELCKESQKSVHFSQFSALSRHYLRTHRKQLLKKANITCRETECTFKSWKVDQLRRHLSSAHGYDMDIQKMTFSSLEELRMWKEGEERRTGNQYVRTSGNHPTRRGGSAYIYYTCRRSTGVNSSLSQKSSAQSNSRCTSSIRLLLDKQTNFVNCEYCPFHYGHDNHAQSRNLSKEEKQWILQLMERGWNTDEILNTLRTASIPGTTERMRKTVRQDLANLLRTQGRRSFDRCDPDDVKSVSLWIQNLQAKGSVIMFKTTAVSESNGPSLLVVMDNDQAELARKYAGSVVHVINVPILVRGRYRLIVLTTASESQGFVLAYALIDDCSPDTLRTIFTAVQNKVGGLGPRMILSQDPAVLSSAWPSFKTVNSLTCGPPSPAFLKPPWMVQREWDEATAKWIRDENQRHSIKKCLEILLAESDPAKFTTFLQLVTVMMSADEAFSPFARYFVDNWTNQVEFWANFHSIPSDLSPLIQLEKEIDSIALRCRRVKRLDKCIYTLDFLSTHQPFEPIIQFRTHSDSTCDLVSVEQLQTKIVGDLQLLSRSVQENRDVTTLRRISQAVAKTVDQLVEAQS